MTTKLTTQQIFGLSDEEAKVFEAELAEMKADCPEMTINELLVFFGCQPWEESETGKNKAAVDAMITERYSI